jgi:hypothetical protein
MRSIERSRGWPQAWLCAACERWRGIVASRPWLGSPLVGVYLPLFALFAATRLVVRALGLEFHLDLGWMFLSDPAALSSRLLETVFYFHAFAPGTNLLTGILLKLAPEHLASAAAAVFFVSGYVLFVSLFQLARALGLRSIWALALSLSFSLAPQSLYFENLYLYTHLCTSLACAAAVLFGRALRVGSWPAWLAFYLPCAVLGWLYTTFHIAWFCMMVVAGAALAAPKSRHRVLLGALLPGLLITSLYLKNYLVFGVFGSTTWGGANLTLATTHRMQPALRERWIREGKLSPYAAISVFAPPEQYLRFFPPDLHFPWPGTNELSRPTVREPNYNHGLFLAVNRQRREDSLTLIKARPLDYVKTVLGKNLPALFSSSTHWHPREDNPRAPHYQHRRALGGYERLYDALVHRLPVPGVGVYALLPLFFVWACLAVWRGGGSPDPVCRRRAVLLGFCVFQVCFVVAASCAFTSQEASRYRYGVEPFIWAIVAAGVLAARRRLERRRTPRPSLAPDAAASGSSERLA